MELSPAGSRRPRWLGLLRSPDWSRPFRGPGVDDGRFGVGGQAAGDPASGVDGAGGWGDRAARGVCRAGVQSRLPTFCGRYRRGGRRRAGVSRSSAAVGGQRLGATLAAQVAVAPILLVAVSTVPLWSPLANVVAGPFVVAAPGLGGIGALLGIDALVALGEIFAGIVLGVAETVAPQPQLGVGSAVAIGLVGLAAAIRALRPLAAMVGAVALAVSSISLAGHTEGPAFVALDVGQGDALVLLSSSGETVLVDGGDSGLVVLGGLARHGVDSIDLLVVTHPHLDHFGGLTDVLSRLPVGQLWYSGSPDHGSEFEAFLAMAAQHTHVVEPTRGRYTIGSISLEVLGPVRRYASPNDQSVVIRAVLANTTVLLTGDVELHAQDDLGSVSAMVLKVPHHGAATSDGGWLASTGASIAVISVGENSFGHPSLELLDDLRAAGMTIRRTDREGDVVVPLSNEP